MGWRVCVLVCVWVCVRGMHFGECGKIACASKILIKCPEGVGAGVREAYGTCTITAPVSLRSVAGLGVLGMCSVIC